MTSYSAMRTHITPIPTPPLVRMSVAMLGGMAIAVPSTNLGPGIQFLTSASCLLLAILITALHPYRKELKEFRLQHNVSPVPTFAQAMLMFITWLALMSSPLLAPAPLWLTVLIWLLATSWMFLIIPHIDGTRVLAFVDKDSNA